MSVFRERVVVCPSCEARERREVAVSINGARWPEHRAAILAGDFDCFECGGCGTVSRLDGPLLYVDLERRHWIGCFPRPWESAWRAVESEPLDTWRRALIDRAPPEIRSASDGYAVRAVFGLPGLREKLLCLDHDLDDRLLEVLKLDLLRGGTGLSFDAASRPVLVEVAGEILRLAVAAPDGEGGARKERVLEVPAAALCRLRAEADAYRAALSELTGGPYVDLGRLLIAGTGPRPGSLLAPKGSLL